MRVTAATKPINKRYNVTLDGERMSSVLEADDEEGYIVQHKRDVFGKLVRTPEGDDFERQRIYGNVVITEVP